MNSSGFSLHFAYNLRICESARSGLNVIFTMKIYNLVPVAGLEPARLFKVPEGVRSEFTGSGEL